MTGDETAGEALEVHFSNEEEDLIALHHFLRRRSPNLRNDYYAAWVLVPLALTLIGLLTIWLNWPGERGLVILGALAMVAAALTAVLYPFVYRLLISRQLSGLAREGANLEFFGEQRLVINPREVACYHRHGHWTLYWPGVEAVEETGDHVFILTATWSAIIVPKRGFFDEQRCEQFSAAARRYLEQAKSARVSDLGELADPV